MNKNIEVSVIIASHRKNTIKDLLLSLSEQKDEKDFEVIVVTDYPSDDFEREYNYFSWIFVNDKSISKKRNEGIKISKGKIIAFIDDDCIADSEWIKNGKNFLINNPEVVAVVGITKIEETKIYGAQLKDYKRLESKSFRTNNLFIRKEVLKKVGSFDERFTKQREDMDLFFNLLTKGYKIDFSDEIKVVHKFRHWEKWDLLKNCWNRRFDTILFLKYPIKYIKHIKTPFSPTQLFVLFTYLIVTYRGISWLEILVLLSILSILTLRRLQFRIISFWNYLREILQLSIAPLVIIFSLVFGIFLYLKSGTHRRD